MLLSRSLPALLVAALGAIGCSPGPSYDAEATAGEALDSNDVGSAESGVLLSAASLRTTKHPLKPATPEEAASRLVDESLPLQFKRWASCGTATASANVVTVHLVDCDTRRGGTISGDLEIAYARVGLDVLAVDAGSNNLKVDGIAAEVHAGATITFAPGKVSLMVNTRSSGTGSRGHTVKRTGSYLLEADFTSTDPCFDLSGDWRTHVDGRLWDTTIDGYHVCAARCPDAGKLDYTGGISGVTVTLEFDGSRAVKWSDTRGHKGTFPLGICIPTK